MIAALGADQPVFFRYLLWLRQFFLVEPAYLIDGAEDLKYEWFEGVKGIGITAGASAPEVLVRGVVEQLRAWGALGETELDGRPENITFSMPKELRVKAL